MRPKKKIKITRRQALGAIFGATVPPAITGFLYGRSQEKKSLRQKPKPKPKPKPEPRPRQDFKIYYAGLKGDALAKAYGVPFTKRVFDLRNVPEALVHDIKVLVANECSKYNRVCAVNPSGKQVVDPYEVLAVIEHESHYNPNARGALGDAGLGQLMPSQMKTISGLSKMPVSVKDPYDPAQNISGVVRTFVWLGMHPANPKKDTTWRRFAAYNKGRGGAKAEIALSGQRYANAVTGIWERMRNNRELAKYA